jgi:hypothetical protein
MNAMPAKESTLRRPGVSGDLGCFRAVWDFRAL